MRENSKYRSEAKLNLPSGFYILAQGQPLQPSDIVWSYTSHEFLRANSPLWIFSPLEFSEDLICAARKAQLSEFEQSITSRRVYKISKF
jgi:hypothetical protein